jgi:hypothetical protein
MAHYKIEQLTLYLLLFQIHSVGFQHEDWSTSPHECVQLNLSQESQELRGSTAQHCGHACVCCGCVGWEGGCSETWRQVCEGEGGWDLDWQHQSGQGAWPTGGRWSRRVMTTWELFQDWLCGGER